ncbi:hypothetical protein [Saccharothrix obliqua]|uniref:hypothetical protein n=1 Tax=Saccharothrix obliqua TaxID=2861747 RepID=UPI001C6016A0|nr:hypothetical protein [Saccharothrix obliqua]MBW4719709.1 hypothetical protein [Saccharothrix obliqua]
MTSHDGAECYVCSSATGERLHLWVEALPDGGLWASFQESELEAVEFTRAEVDQLLHLWEELGRRQRAGVPTDQQWCVVVTEEDSRRRTALIYGLKNGLVTYWRVDEPRGELLLDVNAIDGLIEALRALRA